MDRGANETQAELGSHFVEIEGARFDVHAAPSWLKVEAGANSSVGLLSGTPAAAGSHRVEIEVSLVFPFDCGGSCDPRGTWTKDTPLFAKSCWHNFSIEVK